MLPPSIQLGFFLAALAAAQLPITALDNTADDLAQAANLERFWSYNRSPPVYPSPPMSGAGHWEQAYEEARALVAQMTNDEKNNVTYGMSIPARALYYPNRER
jgi:beta-glucosidase